MKQVKEHRKSGIWNLESNRHARIRTAAVASSREMRARTGIPMIRRSLFFGLTLVLMLGFIVLVIRSCRQEAEPASGPGEMIEKSESTAVRALKPADLEIVRSKTVLERNAGTTKPSFSARHEIEICNRGSVPYKEIRLNFVYLSRTGKVLETRTHSIGQTILPGATLKLADIRMDGFSESAAESRVSIVCADIGNTSSAVKPHN